ncbi:PREDICTED: uncharacterized protein LOC105950540 [Erythranthe guttata]|uniref:uncharacterized protein LOC105950540 n=1 Tax=Erythranthe guttata TaxID=4155 RepID=UPI00064E1128|nr:PREDICTED: uncharacterized protein LOC105950540 [Erythranthe guttata]|eukprot:XP_012829361.1 PREDICTED: uncharacterized protein LOC105950540 [Erythranthe guttata]
MAGDEAPPSTAPLNLFHLSHAISNIKSHIPVILDLKNPIYQKWSHFFTITVGHFCLSNLLHGKPQPDSISADEWQHPDYLLQSWICGTISDDLSSMVLSKASTASDLWTAISSFFTDNKDYRAIQLEEKFKSLKNGTLSIHDYCQIMKTTADSLADVGNPISDEQIVLQTLHGLPKNYGTVANLISFQNPLPTFLHTRWLLQMEETRLAEPEQTAHYGYHSARNTSQPWRAPYRQQSFPSILGPAPNTSGHPSTPAAQAYLTGPPEPYTCHSAPAQVHSQQQPWHSSNNSINCCNNSCNSANVVDLANHLNTVTLQQPTESQWFMDSGATSHMAPHSVLSISLSRSWPIIQLDGKNVFLRGNLSETVYCEQPPGFVDPSRPTHTCRLNKVLYGLKKAPRAWYKHFASNITTMEFRECMPDTSLFVYCRNSSLACRNSSRECRNSSCTYLLLYVNDIVLTASTPELLRSIIAALNQEFAMKDLCDLHYFLGISVTHSSNGLFLSQRKYVDEILERAHMASCNPCLTTANTKSKLSSTTGPPVADTTLDRSLVDALQYLTFTRPDICYVTTSRSSAEAEYRAVANAVTEKTWLHNLLSELLCPLSKAIIVYCDNVSAVYLSSNPIQHSHTKHVEIDIHFVRDKVGLGHVRVLHVPSAYQFFTFEFFTDGKTDSTSSFLKAWNATCNSVAPAAVMVVPKGTFLVKSISFTGPCKSNMKLLIYGTFIAPNDYRFLGSNEFWIMFYRVDGISIFGGTIDAKGSSLWFCKSRGNNCPSGARLISFQSCNNVLLRGLKSFNSQRVHISINRCWNMFLQKMKIVAPSRSPNTDGIHIESSTGITISNSRNAREYGVQDVNVMNSIFVKTENGVRVKSWPRASDGYAKNILFKNLVMKNVSNPIIIDQEDYCLRQSCSPNMHLRHQRRI